MEGSDSEKDGSGLGREGTDSEGRGLIKNKGD